MKQPNKQLLYLGLALGVALIFTPYFIYIEWVKELIIQTNAEDSVGFLINTPVVIGSLLVGYTASMLFIKKDGVVRYIAAVVIALASYQISHVLLYVFNTITMMPLGPI